MADATIHDCGAFARNLLCARFLVGLVLLVHVPSEGRTASVEPGKTDLRSVDPGGASRFAVGEQTVEVSIPRGEGATYGTFVLHVSPLGFASRPLERDGSLETAWVGDVNSDGKQDVVFVIRNGGSGSYVDLFVLESRNSGFSVRRLPPVTPALVPGYMGHDTVSVCRGTIRRSFPTYADRDGIRIDRQWTMEDGLKGESPLKVRPDSNADPSGATVELQFNIAFVPDPHKGLQWRMVDAFDCPETGLSRNDSADLVISGVSRPWLCA